MCCIFHRIATIILILHGPAAVIHGRPYTSYIPVHIFGRHSFHNLAKFTKRLHEALSVHRN